MARRVSIFVAALVLAGAAAAAPGDPKKDFKPPDQRYAASVLLKSRELPAGTWRSERTDFSQPNPDCLVLHYSLSALTVNGEAGLTYTRGAGLLAGGLLVESDADVFLTAQQARRAFATVIDKGLAQCLGTALVTELKASGLKATLYSTTAIRAATAPVQSGGFRLVLGISTPTGPVRLEISELGLLRGRMLASIAVLRSTAVRGPDIAALAATVAARMTKP
jgi:hypothetical protein